ncbi:peptidoglycan DD-metalloendopeptidase family protein [Enterococcus sp. AZ172]|uniref:peptidoglycan DD-metalloendopeptidase family protein n=1 Tax=unclassified Enterococcus TaxID=2608891 RepID=UPI003F24B873
MKKMSKFLCVATLLTAPTTPINKVFAIEQDNSEIDSSLVEENMTDSTVNTSDSSSTTNEETEITEESTTESTETTEGTDNIDTNGTDSTNVPEESIEDTQEEQGNMAEEGGATNSSSEGISIPKPNFNIPTPPTIRQPDLSQFTTEPIYPENVNDSQRQETSKQTGTKSESVELFIQKIGEDARKVGQENDLYASVILAQAILESGAGSSVLSQTPYYNLFGIKGTYKDQSVYLATQEDNGYGQLSTTLAQFRKYSGYEESFQDYAKLMKNGLISDPTFYQGTWKSKTASYRDATKALTGTYATDIYYGEKLNHLIDTYDLTQYDEAKEVTISDAKYRMPLDSYTVSSEFGLRGSEFHRGIDLAAPTGTPIKAAKSGKVVVADTHYSWGNYVVIQHEDGTTMLYAHQESFIVSVGQKVSQGSVIGFVGSTGHSTGPHLHLELCTDASLLKTKLVDPRAVLPFR